MQRAASSKRCARVCAIQGAATERGQPTEREGEGAWTLSVCGRPVPYRAPIPLRSRLHRIANNGDDVGNDASKNPRPPFANCSRKFARKELGEENRSRVAVERATLLSSPSWYRHRPRRRCRSSGRGDRASSAILPSVFAPSRGTRSRRISETLRHSLATKRIERALPFLSFPLLFFLGPDLVHPHLSVPPSPRTTRS